ncbi:MAG: hypothetical protein ACYDH4_12765 [Candidatus Cryosericum sp.]
MASNTELANLALGKLGAKRINDLDTDTTIEADECRTHFTQLRDTLLRSHLWRFAKARATLSESVTAPAFGFAHAYNLPADFLRLYPYTFVEGAYVLEGSQLLTNDTTCEIIYIRRVEDPTLFDPLFVSVFVLELAIALSMAIGQDKSLRQLLDAELGPLMAQVRALDLQEQKVRGPRRVSWLESRRVNIGKCGR